MPPEVDIGLTLPKPFNNLFLGYISGQVSRGPGNDQRDGIRRGLHPVEIQIFIHLKTEFFLNGTPKPVGSALAK